MGKVIDITSRFNNPVREAVLVDSIWRGNGTAFHLRVLDRNGELKHGNRLEIPRSSGNHEQDMRRWTELKEGVRHWEETGIILPELMQLVK